MLKVFGHRTGSTGVGVSSVKRIVINVIVRYNGNSLCLGIAAVNAAEGLNTLFKTGGALSNGTRVINVVTLSKLSALFYYLTAGGTNLISGITRRLAGSRLYVYGSSQ
jgi:hypothetical protein